MLFGDSILLESAVCGAVCVGTTASKKENVQTVSVLYLKKAVKGEKGEFLKGWVVLQSPSWVKLLLGNTQSCLHGYVGYRIVVKN